MKMDWLDKRTKWVMITLAALLAFAILGANILEGQNRHAQCIEALKDPQVGDLVRHLICTR